MENSSTRLLQGRHIRAHGLHSNKRWRMWHCLSQVQVISGGTALLSAGLIWKELSGPESDGMREGNFGDCYFGVWDPHF